MRLIKRALFCIVTIAAGFGCGGSGGTGAGGEGCKEGCTSSSWSFEVTNGRDNCGDPADAHQGSFSVSLDENETAFTMNFGGDEYTGTKMGSTYSASTSRPEDSGVTKTDCTMSIDGTSATGTCNWVWTSDGDEGSCDGGFDISGTKS